VERAFHGSVSSAHCDVSSTTQRPNGIHADRQFRLADHVRLVQPYELPFVVIPANETGTVIDVDPENGDLCISLHRKFDELEHRRNIICIFAAQIESDLVLD
jgi:hypothetical protein